MIIPSSLPITLDRDGEEPIYLQLIHGIRAQIESGALSAGTRLPASRDLARQLQISRISVVNAYAELRAQGYLSAHAGRGTFVARDGQPASVVETTPPSVATRPATVEMILPDRSLRDMMRMARRPGVISLSTGSPPIEFFPMVSLREALNVIMERDGARALGYDVPEGYPPLRAAVRDYVSALGIQCSPNDILITGGTQQALDLVIQALLTDGDTIVTENPTYIGMIDIVRARRLRIYGIPVDETGMRLDYLENYLLDNRPKLIYVMPTFQNPTGCVMPPHHRRRLLNLAIQYDIPILEDSIYHEFRFEGEPLPPLKALDDTGIVIHASGFTKMLLPGMRIGYVIVAGRHYQRLVRVKQAADISTPGLNQRAIHWLLERGVLAGHLERNNRELRRRRDAALEYAQKYLPPGTTWRTPQGGMYLWVELPHNGPTAVELYVTAIQHGVSYAIGNVFFTNNGGDYHLRLNYAAHAPDTLEEGFRRLGHAWQEVAAEYADMEKPPLL